MLRSWSICHSLIFPRKSRTCKRKKNTDCVMPNQFQGEAGRYSPSRLHSNQRRDQHPDWSVGSTVVLSVNEEPRWLSLLYQPEKAMNYQYRNFF